PQKQAFIPPFDVLETPTAYILEGELPGLHDKKQTVIEFTDAQSVLIRGRIDRQDGDEENNESLKASVEGEGEGAVDKVWVAERNVGEFQRGFTLPGSVDVERVEATLEYGVLRIIVPKLAKAGVRRVEI
ncbi:HSP20-like chaperone, partial [Choiromyces venosus 120613-1]